MGYPEEDLKNKKEEGALSSSVKPPEGTLGDASIGKQCLGESKPPEGTVRDTSIGKQCLGESKPPEGTVRDTSIGKQCLGESKAPEGTVRDTSIGKQCLGESKPPEGTVRDTSIGKQCLGESKPPEGTVRDTSIGKQCLGESKPPEGTVRDTSIGKQCLGESKPPEGTVGDASIGKQCLGESKPPEGTVRDTSIGKQCLGESKPPEGTVGDASIGKQCLGESKPPEGTVRDASIGKQCLGESKPPEGTVGDASIRRQCLGESKDEAFVTNETSTQNYTDSTIEVAAVNHPILSLSIRSSSIPEDSVSTSLVKKGEEKLNGNSYILNSKNSSLFKSDDVSHVTKKSFSEITNSDNVGYDKDCSTNNTDTIEIKSHSMVSSRMYETNAMCKDSTFDALSSDSDAGNVFNNPVKNDTVVENSENAGKVGHKDEILYEEKSTLSEGVKYISKEDNENKDNSAQRLPVTLLNRRNTVSDVAYPKCMLKKRRTNEREIAMMKGFSVRCQSISLFNRKFLNRGEERSRKKKFTFKKPIKLCENIKKKRGRPRKYPIVAPENNITKLNNTYYENKVKSFKTSGMKEVAADDSDYEEGSAGTSLEKKYREKLYSQLIEQATFTDFDSMDEGSAHSEISGSDGGTDDDIEFDICKKSSKDGVRRRRVPSKTTTDMHSEVQDQCCGHWFPTRKSYITHLIEKDSDSIHVAKLIDSDMQNCNICHAWLTNSNLKKHLKLKHNHSISKLKIGRAVSKARENDLGANRMLPPTECLIARSPKAEARPCPLSKKMVMKGITCNLQEDPKASETIIKITSVAELPSHLKPTIDLSPTEKEPRVPLSSNRTNLPDSRLCLRKKRSQRNRENMIPHFKGMPQNIKDSYNSRSYPLLDKNKKGSRYEDDPGYTPKGQNYGLDHRDPAKRRNNSNGIRINFRKARLPSYLKKSVRRQRIKYNFGSTDTSESDSDYSDSNSGDSSDVENNSPEYEQYDENIPTVELDLFTLSAFNEDLSILLTDPSNPDFKVFASMDAIFVGDSALGEAATQFGYITDNNNVVYVNPGHFLFPKVAENDYQSRKIGNYLKAKNSYATKGSPNAKSVAEPITYPVAKRKSLKLNGGIHAIKTSPKYDKNIPSKIKANNCIISSSTSASSLLEVNPSQLPNIEQSRLSITHKSGLDGSIDKITKDHSSKDAKSMICVKSDNKEIKSRAENLSSGFPQSDNNVIVIKTSTNKPMMADVKIPDQPKPEKSAVFESRTIKEVAKPPALNHGSNKQDFSLDGNKDSPLIMEIKQGIPESIGVAMVKNTPNKKDIVENTNNNTIPPKYEMLKPVSIDSDSQLVVASAEISSHGTIEDGVCLEDVLQSHPEHIYYLNHTTSSQNTSKNGYDRTVTPQKVREKFESPKHRLYFSEESSFEESLSSPEPQDYSPPKYSKGYNIADVIKGKSLWDTQLLFSPGKPTNLLSPRRSPKNNLTKSRDDTDLFDVDFNNIPDLLSPSKASLVGGAEKFLENAPVALSPKTVSSILSPGLSPQSPPQSFWSKKPIATPKKFKSTPKHNVQSSKCKNIGKSFEERSLPPQSYEFETPPRLKKSSESFSLKSATKVKEGKTSWKKRKKLPKDSSFRTPEFEGFEGRPSIKMKISLKNLPPKNDSPETSNKIVDVNHSLSDVKNDTIHFSDSSTTSSSSSSSESSDEDKKGSPKKKIVLTRFDSVSDKRKMGPDSSFCSPSYSNDLTSLKITVRDDGKSNNSSTELAREWLGRGAKLKAQVLIQDQQSGITNSTVVSDHENPLRETQLSPASSTPIQVNTCSESGIKDRLWHSREAKLKAHVLISDQQKGIFNTSIKNEIPPFLPANSEKSCKDIRSYFSPSNQSPIRKSLESTPKSSANSIDRLKRAQKFDKSANSRHKVAELKKHKKEISERAKKIKSSNNLDIRPFLAFSGQIKTDVNIEDSSVAHKRVHDDDDTEDKSFSMVKRQKILSNYEEVMKSSLNSKNSLMANDRSFEGFEEVYSVSDLRRKILLEYIDVLTMTWWFHVERFSVSIDRLCDWDDDRLNVVLFENG